MQENSIINSSETEKSVLGSIMYSPTIFPRLYGVTRVADFYYPDHRQIFSSMQRLYESGLDINVKTIENDLQRANISISTDLKELLDYRVSTEVAISFATQVAQFSGYRTLQREIENLIPSIKQRDKPLMEYATALNNITRKISSLGVSSQFVSGDELVERYLEMLSSEKGTHLLTGIPDIDEKIFDFSPKEMTFIAARPGVGKALTMFTKILTPTGWVKNHNLRVGDKVIGSSGTPVSVLGVYPQGMRDIYHVEFEDGTTVDCDLEHLWTVYCEDNVKVTLDTETILTRMGRGEKFYIPIPATIKGDPIYLTNLTDGGTYNAYVKGVILEKTYASVLGTLSLPIREAYIQGVMDHHSEFDSTNGTYTVLNGKGLEDVFRSLGAIVRVIGDNLQVTITTATVIMPFRKQEKITNYLINAPIIPAKKQIKDIQSLGTKADMQCIEVDSEDRLFVVQGYNLTHNTALMLQSALHNMKNGTKVGFVSMEMDSSKLTNRMVSHMIGVDSTILRKLSADEALADQRIVDALKFLADDRLYIEDRGPFTIEVVANKIRTMVYEYGCEIVYVDYLGLINAKGESKNVEMANISRALKEVAVELNIPLVVASQLNRDTLKNPNGRPQLHNLRDSGAVEQDATTVMFLYPDVERMSMGGMSNDDIDKYVETSQEVPIKIEVAKQRNGPLHVSDVIFQKTIGTLIEKIDPY